MVPKMLMFKEMGIYNTHWALILPAAFSIYGVFMVRQYMLQIPEELSEAARIDGAGDMRICFQIIAPPLQAGAGNTGHSVLYMELE